MNNSIAYSIYNGLEFCSFSSAASFFLVKQQYFTTAMRKVTTTPTTIPAIFPVAFVAFLVVVVGIRTLVPVYEGLYVLDDPPEGEGDDVVTEHTNFSLLRVSPLQV